MLRSVVFAAAGLLLAADTALWLRRLAEHRQHQRWGLSPLADAVLNDAGTTWVRLRALDRRQ